MRLGWAKAGPLAAAAHRGRYTEAMREVVIHMRALRSITAISLMFLVTSPCLADPPGGESTEASSTAAVIARDGAVFVRLGQARGSESLRLFVTERGPNPNSAYIELDSADVAQLAHLLVGATATMRMPTVATPDPGTPMTDFPAAEDQPWLGSIPTAVPPSSDFADSLVVVRALVDPRGFADRAEVLKGNPALHVEALRVVRQARFKPAISRARPTSSWVLLSIAFSGEH
jgi:hypothetical protein